jgi:hypothetical protein
LYRWVTFCERDDDERIEDDEKMVSQVFLNEIEDGEPSISE